MKLFLLLNFTSNVLDCICTFQTLEQWRPLLTMPRLRMKLDKDEVKAAIVSHLEGLSTSSPVAMVRPGPSIPNQPLLKIEGYGTVWLPDVVNTVKEDVQFVP